VVITPSKSGRCNIGCGGIFRYPFPSVIIQMLVFSQIVVVVGVVYSCILVMIIFVLFFSFELLSGRTKRCKKGFALLIISYQLWDCIL
jgi:hypothetical protein